MITLSLADTETAIEAAFNHWLDQDPNSFTINLSGHNVQVIIVKRGNSFDCGTPGYNMANGDVRALAAWVPNHIRHGYSGVMAPCKNVGRTGQVNVYLRAFVSFNFHVNLVNAC